MIGSQLGKVTGIRVEGDEFIDQVRSFVDGLGAAHWPTIALSASVSCCCSCSPGSRHVSPAR